jgi:hypothetical protein
MSWVKVMDKNFDEIYYPSKLRLLFRFFFNVMTIFGF